MNAVESVPEHQIDTPRLMGELASYAVTHFADEEAYMRSIGYPAELLQKHLAHHAAFLKRLDKLDGAATYLILDYIQEWLLLHIMNEDRQIGVFERSRSSNG
ncbi:MAG: hemerythrin family protein [Spirochaetales bacterium]